MLFFFPKKIEQTAFGTWEHLRGGSSKRKKASKESNEGFDEKAIGTQPVKDSRPFYEPFDDNDLVYCDDGGSDSCYGYPADVFDDDYWSEFDDDNEEEDCEGIDEEEDDDDDGEDDYKLGRYSSKSSEYDEECSESDGECNTGGSTEDWSDNDIKAEVGSDPNYPFFVRLSSYTPDPEGSFNLTSQSTKDSVQKSQKEAGSKGSRNSVGKNSKNSNGKITKDTGVKGKYPISKGSFSQNMRPSSEPDLETPPEEVQTNHRSRRKTRNRPNYVLVDSDILVNTMCPHMLNDFKSSPQQWGKKKEVFVNIYNATVQGQDRARFFPGDQVSSMGSFVRRSMGTLVVGILSSIIPF
ncbi:hypothetical protein JCM33374_g1739 [Metschnikowia sp. JCM 33374]|nr:hypothetical protein JCM33374_g1739 [Metschnikowia sp. JCM 33374]